MQDLTHKVRQALEVYLGYGKAALAALSGGQTEEFFKVMERRDTVADWVRKLDHMAATRGLDFTQHVEFKRLWQEVDLVNRTLTGHLAKTAADLAARQARPSLRTTTARPFLRLIKPAK